MVKAAKAHNATTIDARQRPHRERGPVVKAAKALSSGGDEALLDETTAQQANTLLDEATAQQGNTRSERIGVGRRAEGGSRMQER